MTDTNSSIPLNKQISKNKNKKIHEFSIIPLEGVYFEDLSAREILSMQKVIDKGIKLQQEPQRIYQFNEYNFIYKNDDASIIVLTEGAETAKDWTIFENNGVITPIGQNSLYYKDRSVKQRIRQMNKEKYGTKSKLRTRMVLEGMYSTKQDYIFLTEYYNNWNSRKVTPPNAFWLLMPIKEIKNKENE